MNTIDEDVAHVAAVAAKLGAPPVSCWVLEVTYDRDVAVYLFGSEALAANFVFEAINESFNNDDIDMGEHERLHAELEKGETDFGTNDRAWYQFYEATISYG